MIADEQSGEALTNFYTIRGCVSLFGSFSLKIGASVRLLYTAVCENFHFLKVTGLDFLVKAVGFPDLLFTASLNLKKQLMSITFVFVLRIRDKFLLTLHANTNLFELYLMVGNKRLIMAKLPC